MTSLILMFFAAAVGAAACWLRAQRDAVPATQAEPKQEPTHQSDPELTGEYRPPPLSRKHHFYGASIQPGKRPCEAAKSMLGQRFLTDEAPKLPLAGCTATDCSCRMLPLNDRRTGFDRRDRLTAYGDFDAELRHEERVSPDRRKSVREEIEPG